MILFRASKRVVGRGVKPVASRILGSENRAANKSQRSAVECPNEVLSIKENRCCRRFSQKTIPDRRWTQLTCNGCSPAGRYLQSGFFQIGANRGETISFVIAQLTSDTPHCPCSAGLRAKREAAGIRLWRPDYQWCCCSRSSRIR